MNNRERTIAVFNRRKADRIIWQPRLQHWYDVNKATGTLPEKYRDWDILDIYDDLNASPRAYHYFTDTIKCNEGDRVQLFVKEDAENIYSKYVTPKGTIRQVERKTEHGTATQKTEYFLKTIYDFEVLAYILKHQSFEFDRELYRRMEDWVGDRAEPIINIPWGSIQRLFIVYMGFEKGVIALWRHREKIDELLQVFDANDDERLRVIKKTPVKIVNFGDNIDEDLCSPPLFKRYMLPYYKQRTMELHKAGKFCTSHWDGNIKQVLPFAKETGLDALECVPPKPQGNVTLEELKEGLESMALIDGIPATHFLPLVSDEELKRFVYRILDIFSPYIILGISDMLPPGGDIEKVRIVSNIVADYEI